MRREQVDLVVIGGGPAGMAAALSAYENGVKEIVILERDLELGGILQQCIHNGFGLHYFGEELTGPEYAGRFIEQVQEAGVRVKTNTMVMEITQERQVYAISRAEGMVCYEAGAVVLAMGCRERTREALGIAGTRPAGVFTAGTAQRYINMEGFLPGKRVFILGSGDIGLIMARRLTLEGAQVLGVLEIMPYSNGLTRNIVQCLDDFAIPLYLRHTVVQIHGRERIEGVTIAEVGEDLQPIAGTERYEEVDTLLLSVGLIPENELTQGANVKLDPMTSGAVVNQYRETVVQGIFACGNVLHVHDLVDYVTEEAWIAGAGAALYQQSRLHSGAEIQNGASELVQVEVGENVRYVVPQRLEVPCQEPVEFYLRVTKPMDRGELVIQYGDEVIYRKKERFLRPAEMVKVRLDVEVLARLEYLIRGGTKEDQTGLTEEDNLSGRQGVCRIPLQIMVKEGV